MNFIWTNLALSEYEQITSYLLEKWTVKSAQNFVDNVNSLLEELSSTPLMFESSSAHPYLRKAKISKHSSLIYQLDEDEIVLLRFIDNRSEHLY